MPEETQPAAPGMPQTSAAPAPIRPPFGTPRPLAPTQRPTGPAAVSPATSVRPAAPARPAPALTAVVTNGWLSVGDVHLNMSHIIGVTKALGGVQVVTTDGAAHRFDAVTGSNIMTALLGK